MKLSWPAGANFGRYNNGGGRICIKLWSAQRILVPRRKCRRDNFARIDKCADAAGYINHKLEHDPEKWNPVFRKDHAQTKS